MRRLTQLKLARLRSGERQIDLVFKTGISQSRLSMLELGYAVAKPSELDRLAGALGVPPSMLIDTDEVHAA